MLQILKSHLSLPQIACRAAAEDATSLARLSVPSAEQASRYLCSAVPQFCLVSGLNTGPDLGKLLLNTLAVFAGLSGDLGVQVSERSGRLPDGSQQPVH